MLTKTCGKISLLRLIKEMDQIVNIDKSYAVTSEKVTQWYQQLRDVVSNNVIVNKQETTDNGKQLLECVEEINTLRCERQERITRDTIIAFRLEELIKTIRQGNCQHLEREVKNILDMVNYTP